MNDWLTRVSAASGIPSEIFILGFMAFFLLIFLADWHYLLSDQIKKHQCQYASDDCTSSYGLARRFRCRGDSE